MAFVFKRTETFAVTVNVEMPSDDPRKPIKGSFVARFKHLTKDQIRELQDDLAAKTVTDEQFLDRYLVDVSGIGDASGELDAAAQRALIYAEPVLTLAVVKSFFDGITGARKGN